MSAGALGTPVTDFSSLDFASVQDDLIRYAQSVFPTELWTDFNDSNFGTHLIELMSFATDLITYNSNAQVLETIVTTVIREQNFRNIAKTFDYQLKSAAPSRTTERLTLDPVGAYPFTVSKHLQFASGDGLIFQPDGDTAVAAYPGSGYVDVAVTQGAEQFQETIGTTNGQPSQILFLAKAGLIDGTLSLTVGGVPYALVTNFVAAGALDKVFALSTSEQGITAVIFGDGFTGVIPPKNQAVVVTYKTGGGLTTNMAAGAITSVYGTSDGSLVPAQILSVTNVTTARDGGSKQSLANAKQNLPQSIQANDRAVSLLDFSALAVELVPGVLKANAVAGKFYGGSAPVILFIVPNGGGAPTDALKNLVVTSLKDKKLAGKRIRPADPVYVTLDIEMDLFVKAASPTLVTSNRVRSVVTDKYEIESVNFAQTFALQDAYDSVDPVNVPGVARVFFRKFSALPYYARHINKPSTGNGTVEWINVTTDTVQRREWLIRVLPPSGPVLVNRYQVYERRLGVATAVTDTLLTDETSTFLPNELAGSWVLHPRPEESDTTFAITGNTSQTISVAGALLLAASPDDPYVVERTDSTIGKILQTTVSANTVASAVIPVASVSSWQIGDRLHLSDNTAASYEVLVVGASTLTIDTPVTTSAGALVDYVWQSQDESLRFSVVDSTTAFVVGDEVYVDTFAKAGDIQLRGENFPQLVDANFIINASGGAR